ncbi:hypothetical protein BJX61DRAFT_515635 [Aspergillus egyptiacus]|nr:hypothetical protein BJX61DRAFT_515635 [Aspergillus egyptiacus]
MVYDWLAIDCRLDAKQSILRRQCSERNAPCQSVCSGAYYQGIPSFRTQSPGGNKARIGRAGEADSCRD